MSDTNDIPVQGHEQKTEWSCGPAALKILLSHYGDNTTEEQLIQMTGANEIEGTTHEGLISAAEKLGYNVTATEDTSDDVVFRYLGSGVPFLCDYQGSTGGHYVILTGLSAGRIHIQDPRKHGSQHHTLDWEVFKARWYNITYGDRRLIHRWGMVISN